MYFLSRLGANGDKTIISYSNQSVEGKESLDMIVKWKRIFQIGTIKRLGPIGLSRPLPMNALITKTNNHDGHKGRQISLKSANIKKVCPFL